MITLLIIFALILLIMGIILFVGVAMSIPPEVIRITFGLLMALLVYRMFFRRKR